MKGYDGYVTIGTKLDTSGMEAGLKNLEGSVSKSANALQNTVGKAVNFIKTTIIGAGIALLIRAITKELDGAVERLDTMKNFTNVMSNLGISGKDAEASIQRLNEKLKGLPTSLDKGAMAVQRLASANGNVKASTEMFLALNNAILAGGASAQIQATALEQLSQAYSKGKPDMMEWRTAMTAMPAQLKQVANVMGFVNADALGEALRSGRVSMNEFMFTLMKMNKEGLNGFKSLEEQARNSTGGIQTAIENLKTSFTRALANIMDAIGRSNIVSFFDSIRDAIDRVVPYIQAFIKLIATAISYISALFGKKIKKQADDTSSSVDGLGSSFSSVSEEIDGATGSASKLNKQLKQLAGFDEMNVLKEPTKSGGGSAGGGGGSADLSNMSDFDFDVDFDNVSTKLDEIYQKMLKWAKWFTEDIDLNPFRDSILKLGDALIYLKNGIGGWLFDFIDKFVKPLATYYINDSLPKVLTIIADIIKSIDFDKVSKSLNHFWEALEKLGELTLDGLVWIWENVLKPISTWTINDVLPAFLEILAGAIDIVNKAWQDLQPYWQKFWDQFLKPVMEWTGGVIVKVLEAIGKALKWISENEVAMKIIEAVFSVLTLNIIMMMVAPLMAIYSAFQLIKIVIQEVKKYFTQLTDRFTKDVATVENAWNGVATWFNNNVIQPIKDFFEPIVEFISGIFKTAVENVKIIIENLVIIVKFVWEKIKEVFSPVVQWFKDKWNEAVDKIRSVFEPVINWFKTKWEQIKSAFALVGTFFKSKFEEARDNIKRVFEPIVNFFTGIWDKIKTKVTEFGAKVGEAVSGAFKGVVNGVLKAIESILNTPIKAINKLIGIINEIPGINLKKLSTFSLPRLAKGGIINLPGRGVPVGGSAIGGEAGKEGVIPLTDSQQMQLLGEAIGKYISVNNVVPVYLNGRQIAREIKLANQESDFAYNR